MLDYHPNHAAESKYATVAFLEPPEDPQAIEKLKKDKTTPRNSRAAQLERCAQAADEVNIFEKNVTERRKVEDMEDLTPRYLARRWYPSTSRISAKIF